MINYIFTHNFSHLFRSFLVIFRALLNISEAYIIVIEWLLGTLKFVPKILMSEGILWTNFNVFSNPSIYYTGRSKSLCAPDDYNAESYE